jgi:hypothetical protein
MKGKAVRRGGGAIRRTPGSRQLVEQEHDYVVEVRSGGQPGGTPFHDDMSVRFPWQDTAAGDVPVKDQ